LYDISVQNEQSDDWQPEDTSVELKLSIPGLELHKYAEVRVFHVDDEGNTSIINSELDEDGKIVFETEGFSTFAGFTVDFAYGAALVSIPGETSILMSELFDQMRIPLYASDVVDVQFTDAGLLTVTRQENDWLNNFIVECCEVDESYTEKAGDLFNGYRTYCTNMNEYLRHISDFKSAMVAAGYLWKRDKTGAHYFGLRLKSEFAPIV
jgi:hypothetical protein